MPTQAKRLLDRVHKASIFYRHQRDVLKTKNMRFLDVMWNEHAPLWKFMKQRLVELALEPTREGRVWLQQCQQNYQLLKMGSGVHPGDWIRIWLRNPSTMSYQWTQDIPNVGYWLRIYQSWFNLRIMRKRRQRQDPWRTTKERLTDLREQGHTPVLNGLDVGWRGHRAGHNHTSNHERNTVQGSGGLRSSNAVPFSLSTEGD